MLAVYNKIVVMTQECKGTEKVSNLILIPEDIEDPEL
jgi:hypothetical protein